MCRWKTKRLDCGTTKERRNTPQKNYKEKTVNKHTLERRAERAFKKMPEVAQERIKLQREKRRKRKYFLSLCHI